MWENPDTHPNNKIGGFFDLEKICRSCLEENGTINLFYYIHEGNVLCDIYKTLSLLQVTENDGLPDKLCETCTDFVVQFYNFKQRALQSENVLFNQSIKREQKEENSTCRKGNDDLQTAIYSKKDEDMEEGSIAEQFHSDGSSCEDVNVKNHLELNEINTNQNSVKDDFKITCSYCNSVFDSYMDYKTHRKKEADHRRKKHQCSVCKKMISSYKLKDHINSHTKERPYQCGICMEKFRFRSSLTRHNFRHNDKKPHECHICGKGFIQAPTLTDHIRTHSGEKSFICNICGKSFVTKHALSNHINMHKARDTVGELAEDCSCPLCKKIFNSKSILKNHMLLHSDKTFLCNECGKKFSTKTLLDCHMKIHSGIKPYVCEICKKAFSQKNSLQKHKMTHTGEKPILCIICGKRFSQKGHLTYHMRRHSGERPYTCAFCDKTFNHTGSLKVHIRIHTGEKPFVCDICSKGFYDSSSMKKHRKIHEEIKSGLKLKAEVV